MDSDATWEPPPLLPKRKNAIIRLYDAPVYRDWAAWLTVCMALLAGFSIGFSKSTTGLPVWLNTSLAVIFFVGVFGAVPAYIRLWVRRLMWRRANRDKGVPNLYSSAVSMTGAPPDDVDATSEPVNVPKVVQGNASRGSSQASSAAKIEPAKSRPTVPLLDGGESVNSSLVLKKSRESLQFPIARAIRALQISTQPRVRYDCIIDATEALLITLGIVSISWLRSERLGSVEIEEFREAFLVRGVSQGHWSRMIAALARNIGGSEAALPGVIDGLRRLKKGKGDLFSSMDSLIAERNRSAHGGRPRNETEANLRISEFFPLLELAVDRAAFLGESPWLLVRSSSYRRQGDFRVTADRIMGDHPEFETYSFESATPLVDGNCYMMVNEAPIDLSPLLVSKYCDECHEDDLFYADRLDKVKGVALKSFGRGHVIFDRALDEEIRALV